MPLDRIEEGEAFTAFSHDAGPVNQETYLRDSLDSSPRGNGKQSLIGL